MAEEIRSRQLRHLVPGGELDAQTRYCMVQVHRLLGPSAGAAVSTR